MNICMSNISSDNVAKFNQQFNTKDSNYLIKTAPKPKLKNIPKPITDEHRLLPLLLDEIPLADFDEMDPWTRVVELLDKCDNAVLNKNLDFAEIYYEQVKPFYERLNSNDQRFVFFKVKELQENIIVLRMKKVRKILRAIC